MAKILKENKIHANSENIHLLLPCMVENQSTYCPEVDVIAILMINVVEFSTGPFDHSLGPHTGCCSIQIVSD